MRLFLPNSRLNRLAVELYMMKRAQCDPSPAQNTCRGQRSSPVIDTLLREALNDD
jgi:hypothetical protein